jgi:SNF2 family DNA or RNA helicase
VDNFVINPKRFHESVSPIYLRRNKEDVLRELPAKILKEEWVELTNEDVMAYRSAVRQRNYQLTLRNKGEKGVNSSV